MWFYVYILGASSSNCYFLRSCSTTFLWWDPHVIELTHHFSYCVYTAGIKRWESDGNGSWTPTRSRNRNDWRDTRKEQGTTMNIIRHPNRKADPYSFHLMCLFPRVRISTTRVPCSRVGLQTLIEDGHQSSSIIVNPFHRDHIIDCHASRIFTACIGTRVFHHSSHCKRCFQGMDWRWLGLPFQCGSGCHGHRARGPRDGQDGPQGGAEERRVSGWSSRQISVLRSIIWPENGSC